MRHCPANWCYDALCHMLLLQLPLSQEWYWAGHMQEFRAATVFRAKSWESTTPPTSSGSPLQTLPQVLVFKPKLRGGKEKHQHNVPYLFNRSSCRCAFSIQKQYDRKIFGNIVCNSCLSSNRRCNALNKRKLQRRLRHRNEL